MALNSTNVDTRFFDLLKYGVQKEIEVVYEKMKKEMIERLEKEKNEIVAGIVLNMMKQVQVETMRENLVITIKKIEATQ